MKKMKKYKTVFVQQIPETLERNILYVCLKYNISVHLCACGCGTEVFTPISKEHGWILFYDGENASLKPSIGNVASLCHSHYFLKDGEVQWLTPIKQSAAPIEQSTVPFRRSMKRMKKILQLWKERLR